MNEISEQEIIDKLTFDNVWWQTGSIDDQLNSYPRREYFPAFYKLLTNRDINRAVVLMGPRRVGKTVLVSHAIQKLLEEGIDERNILYVSMETPLYTGLSLERLLNFFQSLFSHKRNSNLYIFFDEIQYLKDWEVHLKSLVDSYKSYRFTATGSAAAALRLKSNESGAGRFTDFMLPPLTFVEYLQFVEKEDELIGTQEVKGDSSRTSRQEFFCLDINSLNEEFINYLNYGGYPEAVKSESIRSDTARFIKADIIEKVLLRDLPSLYGIHDIQELNRLFTTLAYNTGNEVSLEPLSQTSGVAKNTIKKYLEYLQAAFLIKRVERVDHNATKFKRTTAFKVYLTNPSMRAALFGYVTPESEAMGNLTETAIYSQWLHSWYMDTLYYARWDGGEVDIVNIVPGSKKPNWAVEVKWSDRVAESFGELKPLLRFAEKHGLKHVLVTTRTYQGEIERNGLIVHFIPSSLQAYRLGKNILKHANRLAASEEDENESVK